MEEFSAHKARLRTKSKFFHHCLQQKSATTNFIFQYSMPARRVHCSRTNKTRRIFSMAPTPSSSVSWKNARSAFVGRSGPPGNRIQPSRVCVTRPVFILAEAGNPGFASEAGRIASVRAVSIPRPCKSANAIKQSFSLARTIHRRFVSNTLEIQN